MQPVVAAMPRIVRIAAKEQVRRLAAGVDVHRDGVLATLLLAVVQSVNGCAVPV